MLGFGDARLNTYTHVAITLMPCNLGCATQPRLHQVNVEVLHVCADEALPVRDRFQRVMHSTVLCFRVCGDSTSSMRHKTRRRHFSKSPALTLSQHCGAVTLERSTSISNCASQNCLTTGSARKSAGSGEICLQTSTAKENSMTR